MPPNRAIEQSSPGPCASRYAIYSRYIALLVKNKQAENAENLRLRALAEYDEADRHDHKLFLRIVHDQVAIDREQGNDDAVDELHQTVIGKFRRIFGHQHKKTIMAMHDYGKMLCGDNRYEQAEALYRTLVDELDCNSQSDSVHVLGILNALGVVYTKREKLKQAEAILVRAVTGFQRHGERDVRTLTAAFNLANAYQNLGKLSLAVRMYHVAAYGFMDAIGVTHSTTITAFKQLAALCVARRATSEADARRTMLEAETAYNFALQGLEETGKQDSIESLILKLDLGMLYRDWKRFTDAERITSEAYKSLKHAQSGYAPGALTCLGTIYARQGLYTEAEASFTDAMKEFPLCGDEYSVMSYAAAFNLGNLARKKRQLADAEAMYQQAWKGSRSVGGLSHVTSCTIAQALGSLYEEQGRYEEAEELYRQILWADENPIDRWTSYVLCLNFQKMTGCV